MVAWIKGGLESYMFAVMYLVRCLCFPKILTCPFFSSGSLCRRRKRCDNADLVPNVSVIICRRIEACPVGLRPRTRLKGGGVPFYCEPAP